MGKLQNPLIPEMKETPQPERQGQPEKLSLTLAEKTVEDVLLYFGDSLREARANYRRFVEKRIKKGRQHELQGGGLIRTMGGKGAALSEIRSGQGRKVIRGRWEVGNLSV